MELRVFPQCSVLERGSCWQQSSLALIGWFTRNSVVGVYLNERCIRRTRDEEARELLHGCFAATVADVDTRAGVMALYTTGYSACVGEWPIQRDKREQDELHLYVKSGELLREL